MAFSVKFLNPPLNIPTSTPAPDWGGPVACLGGPLIWELNFDGSTSFNTTKRIGITFLIELTTGQTPMTLTNTSNHLSSCIPECVGVAVEVNNCSYCPNSLSSHLNVLHYYF